MSTSQILVSISFIDFSRAILDVEYNENSRGQNKPKKGDDERRGVTKIVCVVHVGRQFQFYAKCRHCLRYMSHTSLVEIAHFSLLPHDVL